MPPKKREAKIEEDDDEAGDTVGTKSMMTLDSVLAGNSTEEAPVPVYIIEKAKSGRAQCRSCDEKINMKEIRVGVILDGDWGNIII